MELVPQPSLSDLTADFLIWIAELPIFGEYIICPIIYVTAILRGTDMDN